MRVLADFHHASLLQSLILLFERRLGYEVYRPIGLDWFHEGYWRINDQVDTATQYLSTDQSFRPADGTPPLNEINSGQVHFPEGFGAFFCEDIGGGERNKAILLEDFKKVKFDILIASLPQHIEPFKKLIQLYQPQAKLIYQIGNQWQVNARDVTNVMASAKVTIPDNVNGVIYHQEFDTNIFKYEAPKRHRTCYSFINCLGTADLFRDDWTLFLQLEAMLPDWEFKSFGGQCRDGNMQGSQALADKMREADFIFHCKTGGDGYGHIIHNAASVGRILITREKDYFDKLAQPLIQQANHIRVDDKKASHIADEIVECYSNESLFLLKSENAHKAFVKNVDFDKESVRIKKFLEQLK